MEPVIVTYIPVLHEGYRRFLAQHAPAARDLYIFSDELIRSYEHLVKDIRRLDAKLVQQSVAAWQLFEHVHVLNQATIEELQRQKTPLIVSDDDLTRELIEAHFANHPIQVDTVFLRWDKKTSIQPIQVSPDVIVSEDAFDQDMMAIAHAEGEKSRDWWRRIGALAVRDKKILLRAHNIYTPSEQIAYDEGDPRSNFKSGMHLESSLALHAEAGLVAQAAKEGISLNGADIYTETFPCPPCAKQLAYSGIRRLYYRIGYNVLDGERILKSQGVQIIFVSGNSSVVRI